MIRIAISFLSTSIALTACNGPADGNRADGNRVEVNRTEVNGASVVPAVANATGQSADIPAACTEDPEVVLLRDFEDPHNRFAQGSVPFYGTDNNFLRAYRQACRNGMIRGRAWVRVILRNAPLANAVSIYTDIDYGAPEGSGRVILEYAFVTDDDRVHVPHTNEIMNAIRCHVEHPSSTGQEEDGRCRPD